MSFSDGIEERVAQIRRRDRRYARNGYYFVLDALDYTIEALGRDQHTGESRHVGGRELLLGLKELAATQFGPLATVCLERWGIRTTEDVGEIVFNLIDCGLLSRRPSDSRLDFADGFDFARNFEEKFRERLEAISQAEFVL
ncbi:MAG: hypothetical protein KDC87_00265 [Planctomycetes bacterium]|nr:hypothetical protein [Planctomycetota bacterium]